MTQTKLIENENNKLFRCCPLWKNRTNVVWIRGTVDKDADVLFVGEGPGRDEDLLGKPFVGRAGKILDQWIKDAEIEKYAIINVVKCRPPDNRPPKKEEIDACYPYLIKQIKELNPKLIVALGRTASIALINKSEITKNIGKIFPTMFYQVMIFPHPAFILRGADINVPIDKLKEVLKGIKERNM